MTEEQYALLVEARHNLRTTKSLLQEGNVRIAASRAYYTMFYVATALLLQDNLRFSKHSAVIAAFGERLCKTKKVPIEFHRYLTEAQTFRITADYKIQASLDKAETAIVVERAEKFVVLGEQILGPVTEHENE